MPNYDRFTEEELNDLSERWKEYLKKFNISDEDFKDILRNWPKDVFDDFIRKIPSMITVGQGIPDMIDIAMFVGMLWERSRRNDSV